ncbi:coiled-coil-helix-coiled-coil-helix domain-containing protein 10, mitochondrial-like [Pectinophora gossypiella]|uniref:coiled-coil-helix-coiled-coil-helix domain-containing protein 10, mitochondrial-like n=1 Tax=Pectinophora gossypiella TaxID=13191 RepID=UPI00214E8DE9|nr:coiled-coil-helix-coiled-coil-helix domain-containing protein 10, mitochondrial-like [Pectinophora gossypiella]
MPRRSLFGEAATVAGGVAVGNSLGHVAGQAITGMLGGRHREEIVEVLPRNYTPGTDPTGPCAYEISQFLQCASTNDDISACQRFNDLLQDCKRRNGIP